MREITIANDGIVNQKAAMAYAANSFSMIEELDRWGVKFERDETGDYAVKKVHHMGSYVLPMPEGHDIKKVLYGQLKKTRVEIEHRLVATRLLAAEDGRIAGAMAFDCRSADFHVIRAKSVVLSTGAAGRLGLPASGYLFGTYENPTNAGDGYSMAYHAGAELYGIVVPRESKVTALSELKGRTISVPFASTAHGMLLRAVAAQDWDPQKDVNIISQAPEVAGPALQANKIEAHADFVPFAELFEHRGIARKIFDGAQASAPTYHGSLVSAEYARSTRRW